MQLATSPRLARGGFRLGLITQEQLEEKRILKMSLYTPAGEVPKALETDKPVAYTDPLR